ncbi:MAG: hypothetical protein WBR29_11115 [Gammaproteobacteria bacterium]
MDEMHGLNFRFESVAIGYSGGAPSPEVVETMPVTAGPSADPNMYRQWVNTRPNIAYSQSAVARLYWDNHIKKLLGYI